MHPTAEHPTAEHPTTEHPTTVLPTYEAPTYGQPTAERSGPGRPGPGHPVPEHPTGIPQPQYAGWHDTAVLPGAPEVTATAPGRRSPDVVALVAGALFVLIAVLGLIGTSLPGWVFGGGLVAAVLVAIGAVLLVTELRRLRR